MSLGTFYDSAGYHFPAESSKDFGVAAYINGRFTPESVGLTVEELQDRYTRVVTIDVFASEPKAEALDVETGDATPAQVPQWVADHATYYSQHGLAISDIRARIYCNLSTWPLVKQHVAGLSFELRQTVRYWIANPTGIEHIVPGSAATQWYWGGEWDQNAFVEGQF